MRSLLKLRFGAEVIAKCANALGTLCVLALIGIVATDIIARGAFNAPIMGTIEIVQFSMVLIVFLQLPDVVRAERLTRSDGFLLIARRRWPTLARRLGQVIDTVSCLFMVAIAVSIWPEFVEMLETKDYFGIPGVFTAPWWPIKLVIFISAALAALLFALRVLTGESMPEKTTNPDDVVS